MTKPSSSTPAHTDTTKDGDAPLTCLGEAFPRTPEQLRALDQAGVEAARGMIRFIDRCPTPYHVTHAVAERLQSEGFERLSEQDAWTLAPGDRRFIVREDATVVAFVVGKPSPATAGFRLVGAHTDSPCPRLKPKAPKSVHGYQQLAVEPYGGGIWATWSDRDLSIAGRVLCAGQGGAIETELVDLQRPVARIANAAIHLNRTANEEGLKLNPQKHMLPIVGLGDELDLIGLLEGSLDRPATDIVSFDLALYDAQPGAIGGLGEELVFCARLDNLASTYTAIEALLQCPAEPESTAVVVLYDHEECGSRSIGGAAGPFMRDVLDRIVQAHPQQHAQGLPRALAASWMVSADMAHAVHPNYADLHDGDHQPKLNRGLVIKTNVNQSYATSGPTAAWFDGLCREAGYQAQQFVSRSDLRCGSSIGPIASTELGIRTVDVGAPMLSMHSVREMCGTRDVHLAIETFKQVFG